MYVRDQGTVCNIQAAEEVVIHHCLHKPAIDGLNEAQMYVTTSRIRSDSTYPSSSRAA